VQLRKAESDSCGSGRHSFVPGETDHGAVLGAVTSPTNLVECLIHQANVLSDIVALLWCRSGFEPLSHRRVSFFGEWNFGLRLDDDSQARVPELELLNQRLSLLPAEAPLDSAPLPIRPV